MTITIQLETAESDTYLTLVTPRAVDARKFLEREDHEGSVVTITVTADNEEAYRILRSITTE